MRSEESPGDQKRDGRGLSGRRWLRRSTLVILVVAGVVAGSVSVRLWALKRAALDEAKALLPAPTASAMNTARVLGSIRQLKLVTVELATYVNSESDDESWRGDVRAKVSAPVKLHFGTDLSKLKAESLRASSLGNSWIVTVPAPERIATEVFGEREETDVHVGWLRSRSMSGEKHLGLARRELYEAARGLKLSDDDMQWVRGQTREQVAALMRSIVGQWASVTVRFDDEVGIAAAGAGGTGGRGVGMKQ